MNIEQMRRAIILAYLGKKWEERCLRMNDNQVIAIYNRLKLKGKIH